MVPIPKNSTCWHRLAIFVLLFLAFGAELFSPHQARAAGITHVQGKYWGTDNGNQSATSCTFTALSTTGNLIVVAARWISPGVTGSLSDNKGNTYSLAIGPVTANSVVGQVWYLPNAPNSISTITLTWSSNTGG